MCTGGTQQCLVLLAPHLRSSNIAGDIARVQKKGVEGFWGFLSVFLLVAIEELSGDRVRVVLKNQRKGQSSRSSSNLGTSCKVLSTILGWKSSVSLYTVAQNFCTEPEKSDP